MMKLIIIYIIYVFFVMKGERSVESNKKRYSHYSYVHLQTNFHTSEISNEIICVYNVLFLFTWNQYEKTLLLKMA